MHRPAAKEPFIFGMGRVWDEAKNLGLLAEVAAELPWPVYIAGNAQHPAAGRVQPLPNVHFLGQLSASEAAEWLGRAAIYALPAAYEPFGLTLLEAALSGCVLVAGDLGTLREVWNDAAWYVNPHDAGGLLEALRTLIQDEALRQRLAASATARAALYPATRLVASYGQLYRQLLGAPVLAG